MSLTDSDESSSVESGCELESDNEHGLLSRSRPRPAFIDDEKSDEESKQDDAVYKCKKKQKWTTEMKTALFEQSKLSFYGLIQ